MPGAAPFAPADFRSVSPELGRGVIEERDSSGGIGRVDGRREGLEQLQGAPFPITPRHLGTSVPGFDLGGFAEAIDGAHHASTGILARAELSASGHGRAVRPPDLEDTPSHATPRPHYRSHSPAYGSHAGTW